MKVAIIFYSFSGNTKMVAAHLRQYFNETQNASDIIKIKALDESRNFFIQCGRALKRVRAQIEEVKFDLSEYDQVCFGTPVWAFGPAPAINTYLDNCSGLGGKAVILFTTYGSGTGNERCLNYMQTICAQKGAVKFGRFSIQQGKVLNKELVFSKIKEALLA